MYRLIKIETTAGAIFQIQRRRRFLHLEWWNNIWPQGALSQNHSPIITDEQQAINLLIKLESK